MTENRVNVINWITETGSGMPAITARLIRTPARLMITVMESATFALYWTQ